MTEDEAIRAVAAREWGSGLGSTEPHVGFNRRTWRAGERLWITGMDATRRELLERENRLLERLETTFQDADVNVEVRATVHLAGERADGEAPEDLCGVGPALRVLHAALRSESGELAVMPPFLAEVESTIERNLGMSWSGVTRDDDEHDLVCAVAESLVSHLPDLQLLPCQLTHGDWSLPNWLVDETGVITAVIDWQMATLAPAIVDLAQVLSGVLMFSALPIEQAAPAIEKAYGLELQTELLPTAMAAYWFRNYWLLRDELGGDPRARGGTNGVERQPGRLRAVLCVLRLGRIDANPVT